MTWRCDTADPSSIYFGDQFYGRMNSADQAGRIVEILSHQQRMIEADPGDEFFEPIRLLLRNSRDHLAERQELSALLSWDGDKPVFEGGSLRGVEEVQLPKSADGKHRIADMIRLWDRVVEWRDKHELSCSESIFQMDGPQIDAANLCDDVVSIVGFIPFEEDE